MTPRMILLGLLMLSVTAGVVVAGHAYVYLRLAIAPGLGDGARGAVLAALIAFGALMVAQPVLERAPWPRRVARPIGWVAYSWMGFAFLLLAALGLGELVGLVAGVGEAPWWPVAHAVGAVAVAGLAFVVGLVEGVRAPRVIEQEHRIVGWPDPLEGFRIVQISDIHIGPLLGRGFADSVTRRVLALAPDLVAVTGDLVDGAVAQLTPEVAPFARLAAPHGVWFVTGNHELYSGADAWVEATVGLGWTPLRNQHVVVEGEEGGRFVLAGVNDRQGRVFGERQAEDVPAALRGAPEGLPVVLIAHDPSTFNRAWDRGVALQLSGHTHGGQIWPFAAFVRLATPYVAGRFQRGDAALYVSRGTGFWGPPLRLGAPAEITVHRLIAAG